MKKSILGKILLLITTLVWGSSFFILKNTIDEYPIFFVLTVRFGLSAVVLGLIFIKKIIKINKTTLLHGAILGLILAAAYALQTLGLKYTTPAKNAFITAFYVVLVPFMGWLLLKEKPKLIHTIAAFLCLAGIGCVSLNSSFSIGIGDLLTLASGIFYGLQIIFIKKYIKKDDSVQLLVIELFVIAVVFLVISAIFEKFPAQININSILPLLYLTLVCTALAQLMQIFGQKYTSHNSASIILGLESVFGTVFSVIFYNERLALQTIVGFVIIFIAEMVAQIDFKSLKSSFKKEKYDEKTNEGPRQ